MLGVLIGSLVPNGKVTKDQRLISGGDNDFNYDFHTLLIQTFARGSWLDARLST